MEGRERRMEGKKGAREASREDRREGRLFSIYVICSHNLSNLPLYSTVGKVDSWPGFQK